MSSVTKLTPLKYEAERETWRNISNLGGHHFHNYKFSTEPNEFIHLLCTFAIINEHHGIQSHSQNLFKYIRYLQKGNSVLSWFRYALIRGVCNKKTHFTFEVPVAMFLMCVTWYWHEVLYFVCVYIYIVVYCLCKASYCIPYFIL